MISIRLLRSVAALAIIVLSHLPMPTIAGATQDEERHVEEMLLADDDTMNVPSIFVINLEYRKERLEHLEEELGGLNYTRIDAADPVYSNEEVAAGRAKLNDTYLDPMENRRMKTGEVGCALSHLKAWEAISSSVPPDEYAIVLEDDIAIDDDIVHDDVRLGDLLDKIAAAAAHHDTDFVYLAYKNNDDEEPQEVDDLFCTCTPSHWTLAYMIRSKAASRLVDDAESYRMNLIPSDEYLPIVLGTLDANAFSESINKNSTTRCSVHKNEAAKNGLCHHSTGDPNEERSTDPRYPTGDLNAESMDPRYPNVRLSCLSLNERLFWPSDTFEVRSDTEASSIVHVDPPHERNDGLLVVTVATDESHFGYQNLRRSADYFGYHVEVLGTGQEWNGGDMVHDTGGGLKISMLKGYLDRLRDTDKDENGDRLILFTDGYDTMFNLGPSDLLERYFAHPSDVVFGAEVSCWPDYDLCEEYEDLLEMSGDSVSNYPSPYLNSGTYIGKAKHIRDLLEEFSDIPDDDDQRYFTAKFVEHLRRKAEDGTSDISIGLDLGCDLFQTMNGFPSDGWDVYEDTFANTITDSDPVLLHGNGYSVRTLLGIGNYIAGGFDEFYGPKRHVLLGSEQIDIYPLAIGIFFTGTLFELEFLEGVSSLALDWTQVSIYIYYETESRLRVSEELGAMFSNITELPNSSECLARSAFLEMAHDARFALMIDSDTILERSTTVMDLARWNQTVVAGHAQTEDRAYSNFWSDMDSEGDYKDGFDYLDISNHEKVGLWHVPFAGSLLLFRADVFEAMATLYAQNEDSMESCSQYFCADALDNGVAFFLDNREVYGTLLVDEPANPDSEFPELYEVETNPKLWAKRYMVPDYENVELEEVCPDVYGAVLFNKRFCEELILTAEGVDSWSSGDHDDSRLDGGYEYVPTQDVHMYQLDWETQWITILQDIVAPFVIEKYDGITFDGDINIAFVVRYIMSGQRELEPHNDASAVTTTVLLNNGFTGGGVEFTRYNCMHRSTDPGFFLMHPGRVTHNHKAYPITSGTRYVLVSFNE